MRYSTRDGYHVFHWPEGPYLFFRDLWNRYPSIVVGRYLVNTSFDSGFLTLSQVELQQGWFMIGNLAHSPQIDLIESIPNDDYDEYLVFEHPIQVDHYESFLSCGYFNPSNPLMDSEVQVFWEQVNRLRPLHVLGQNDFLYLVTRDERLASSIAVDLAGIEPPQIL